VLYSELGATGLNKFGCKEARFVISSFKVEKGGLMRRNLILVISALALLVPIHLARGEGLSSTIGAAISYTGIIRTPTVGLSRHYKSGFGTTIEYTMSAKDASGWFLKHSRLGISASYYWLYHFSAPEWYANYHLLLFSLTPQIVFMDMDGKILPYAGLSLGGGITISGERDVNGGIKDVGEMFDLGGIAGVDYRFTDHISLTSRIGASALLGKGPSEDRVGKNFATYPKFSVNVGVGYTF